MAIEELFLVPLNLNKNELRNTVIQVLASAPGSPVLGQFYYDSTNHHLYVYNGSGFEQASGASGSGSVTSVDISLPSWLTVSGNPITTSGTLVITAAGSQTANRFLATPDSSSGALSLRAITANDIPTLTASKIGDFDTQVRTSRLDQLAAPTTNINLNSHKITNLLDPTAPQDAASKFYVDAVSSGLDVKASCRVATTTNGTLATAFVNGSVVDGVTLATGDRILLKNQTTGSENGIYTVNASGAPTRSTDADSNQEVTGGMFTFVEEGTANANSGWVLTNSGTITLGTTALTFSQFSGAGQITFNSPLSKSGNTVSLTLGLSDLPSGAAKTFSASVGDGSATSIAVTHNLGSRDVMVMLRTVASPFNVVHTYWEATDINNVTLYFTTAPTTAQYRVKIIV
jgi:hypothetical protein